MEKQIKVDPEMVNLLLEQDLNFLHHFVSATYIKSQTKKGGAEGLLSKDSKIESLYVMLIVLDHLRDVKQQQPAA